MDPGHPDCGSTRSFVAAVLLAVTTVLSCAPAGDSSDTEQSRNTDVRVSQQSASPFASNAATAQSQAVASAAGTSFTLFESGQVRPLAMSPDRQHLFAVNTPDNRLEIFRIEPHRLVHTASIPVGLEPVAVAARSDREVWVVNHLSDSVSVIALDDDAASGRVERTLLVGDEPRDIAFAGPGRRRAFITTAHRGQNIPFDPQLTTAGVGRADVWVFDADALGDSLGGTPLTIVTLFTDTPRALAVTPDGTRVYAAGFHTGNQTTTVGQPVLPGFGQPGGQVGPTTNHAGAPAPDVGEIVKWNGSHWVNTAGTSRDELREVLAARQGRVRDRRDGQPAAPARRPRRLLPARRHHPVLHGRQSGQRQGLRRQHRRQQRRALRGPRQLRRPQPARPPPREPHHRAVTQHRRHGGVAPRHLNKHIDFHHCCAPVPNAENARSLALPQGMAVTRNGATLYVAALGSDKVGIFSTAQLENDTFVPSAASQIHVSGGGPTGLVLDEDRGQLFVLTRFDDAISVIDTRARSRGRARRDAQPRAGQHHDRPPVPVRRVALVGPRRLGVRQLPRVRRLRQPRLGPRQPRRRCHHRSGAVQEHAVQLDQPASRSTRSSIR